MADTGWRLHSCAMAGARCAGSSHRQRHAAPCHATDVPVSRHSQARSAPASAGYRGSGGCSRPFLAEIALVGKAPGRYNLYLGASATGDRLNRLYLENIDEARILGVLGPLLRQYAKDRHAAESFGDFVVRIATVRAMVHGREFQTAAQP